MMAIIVKVKWLFSMLIYSNSAARPSLAPDDS